MKRIIPFLFFIFILSSSYSQDLIVIDNGDSINCKITQVTQDRIYYIINFENYKQEGSYALSQVKQYGTNYDTHQKVLNEFSNLRVALNVGYSRRISGVSPEIPYEENKDYLCELRQGINFGIDVIRYRSEHYGFGLKTNVFLSSASTDNYYDRNYRGEAFSIGKINEDIVILFIAPAFSYRIPHGINNNSFFMNASAGYMGYFNNAHYSPIEEMSIRGQTVGLGFDIGYDIGINKDVMFGIQISCFVGGVSNFNVDVGNYRGTLQLEKGTYEGLNRIDISLGLRFR